MLKQLATALLFIPLSACAALLGGGGKADSLYRFTASEPPVPAFPEPKGSGHVAIQLDRIRFAPEIEGDRIMTTSEQGVLYLAGARWVAPARDLMTQAILRQFEEPDMPVILLPPSARLPAGWRLQISFDTFEARYQKEGKSLAPPTIIVGGTATMSDTAERSTAMRHQFWIEQKAQENGRSSIVLAFSQATSLSSREISQWAAGEIAKKGP